MGWTPRGNDRGRGRTLECMQLMASFITPRLRMGGQRLINELLHTYLFDVAWGCPHLSPRLRMGQRIYMVSANSLMHVGNCCNCVGFIDAGAKTVTLQPANNSVHSC